MMYSQISIWAFRDRKIMEAMTMARQAGFAGIELAIGETGEITPDTPANELHNYAAAAKACGLKIGSVASGMLWGVNPASKDKATRDRAVELTKKSLAATAELGAKHLLVLIGHVDVFFMPGSEVVPYDDCYKRSLDFCREIGKAAAKLGVTACVENVWNRFLLSPMEFAEFIDTVKSKAVGVYFDVGNVWNFGYPQHWIEILGKRIGRVHVKDFRRAVGNANGFCNLLDGDVPLKESLRLLKKVRYSGPVTAEVAPGREDVDDMAFLNRTAERLASLLPK